MVEGESFLTVILGTCLDAFGAIDDKIEAKRVQAKLFFCQITYEPKQTTTNQNLSHITYQAFGQTMSTMPLGILCNNIL